MAHTVNMARRAAGWSGWPQYPGPVSLTLRQRNRLAAVQRITDTAMALFDARGYSEVTVEEIAQAAGVSPRTFYRYFGTKEGLFTTDVYAAVGAGPELLAGLVDPDDLPGTLERVVAFLAGGDDGEGDGDGDGDGASDGDGGAWRGMRYVLAEPAVRAAVYAAGDAMCDRLAELLRSRGTEPTRARVVARTFWFGVYFGALEQWHLDGRVRPVGEYVRAGLAALRGPFDGPATAPPPG